MFALRIEELIHKHFNDLNDTDLHIWKYIVNHKKECCHYTIYELADQCNVSRTTILRFANKLSLSGYSELKALLKIEDRGSLENTGYDIQRAFDSYYRTIEDMKKKDFSNINEMIAQAKQIYVYATGVMQKNIARELQRLFNTMGTYIIDIGSSGEINHFLKKMDAGSLVFIISLKGENVETIEFVRKLKLKDVPVISMTMFRDNTLATMCDENIYIYTLDLRAMYQDQLTLTSSVGFFVAVETLYMRYQMYHEKIISQEIVESSQ